MHNLFVSYPAKTIGVHVSYNQQAPGSVSYVTRYDSAGIMVLRLHVVMHSLHDLRQVTILKAFVCYDRTTVA